MRRSFVALLVMSLGGCALFSKGDVTEPRYFSPSAPHHEGEAPAKPPSATVKLRLGRISSGDHLRQRIVFRSSPVEVGEYPDFRWTEKPEEYVRRALVRALFEDRGLTQAVGGAVATLDVELLAFEEVRQAGKRMARVGITYAVRDERVVLAAHTVTVDRPVTSADDMQQLVEAMSLALDEASETMAGEVAAALEARQAEGAVTAPSSPPASASSSAPPARR